MIGDLSTSSSVRVRAHRFLPSYSTSHLTACIVFVDDEEDEDEVHIDIISSLLEVFHALLLSNCYPTEVLSNCF